MTWVAVGVAGVGAAASIGGGMMSSNASKSAASASERVQTQQNKISNALAQQQYYQGREDLSPYRTMGIQANPWLMQATLGGDVGYWQQQAGMQPGFVAPNLYNSEGRVVGENQLNAFRPPNIVGGNTGVGDQLNTNYQTALDYQDFAVDDTLNKQARKQYYGQGTMPTSPEELAAYNSQFAEWQGQDQFAGLNNRQQKQAMRDNPFVYNALAQPADSGIEGSSYTGDGANGLPMGYGGTYAAEPSQYAGESIPQTYEGQPTGMAGPTGMSPGLTEVRGQVDRLSQMNSQFNPQGLPDTQVGTRFTAPTVGNNWGRLSADSVTAGQANQQFTEGQVNPNIAVDYQSIINDPMYQFALQQAQESANMNLSAQGLRNSGYATGIMGDIGMQSALAARDRVYGQGVDLFNRNVGNQGRLLQSQQLYGNQQLANIGNTLQADLSNQGANLTAGQANMDSRMQADLANAGYNWGAQQANYGMDTDNYGRALDRSLLGYDVDVANYGREAGQLGNYIDQLSSLEGTQYGRIANLAGIGQNAAVQMGQNGQNYVDTMTANNQNYANSMGTIYGQRGAAESNAWSNAGNTLAQMGMIGGMAVANSQPRQQPITPRNPDPGGGWF